MEIVKTLGFVKELTQEDFIKELDKIVGKNVNVDIVGGISFLHNLEAFDYYTYTNSNTLEDFIAIGNADDEDNDLRICLDCVELFRKDIISNTLFMHLENGMIIQIYES